MSKEGTEYLKHIMDECSFILKISTPELSEELFLQATILSFVRFRGIGN